MRKKGEILMRRQKREMRGDEEKKRKIKYM
jgi:hypothetical protein